jgi:hypothetical protein
MSEQAVDFEALAAEIEIDRQVRLGLLMIELDEAVQALVESHRRCDQNYEAVQKFLDSMEANKPPHRDM